MTPINNLSILIVEDDEPKLRSVHQYLVDEFPEVDLDVSKSLSSAIGKLASKTYDFAIVDMSLPTYEFAVDKAGGGKPQGFAGADILRFIDSECVATKAIVLTQYEEFLNLSAELRLELGPSFLDFLYYSGQQGSWRNQLGKLLTENLSE